MVLLRSRSTRQTPIGLDIGATGVRAVQLRFSGNEWVTIHTGRNERAPADREDERKPDVLEREVRACLRQAEFRGRRVITALNPPDVEFHALDLPPAILAGSSADLVPVVHSELLRLVGGSGENVETRHWVLPATRVPGPNAMGAAVRGEVLHRTLTACRQARLECSCIDTAATALCRFGGLLNNWGPDCVWGVLDAGCRQTRLVLCVDDVPVLARAVGTGGREWTQRIAGALEISFKSAEVQKREHGLTLPGRDNRSNAEDARAAELGSVLRGILRCDLNDLAAEVKRSYEYLLSCYPPRRAGDLVLVGGGAAVRNLPEFLTEALGIPVRPASSYLNDESCRLRYASGKQSSLESLGLAVGLAVGV